MGHPRAIAAALLCLPLLAAGCAAQQDSGPRQTIRFGNTYETAYPLNECGATPLVEEAAAEGLDMRLYPGGQLGSESQMLEQVMAGELEMSIAGPGFLSKWHDPIGVLEAPYLFGSSAEMVDYARGPEARRMWDALARKTGVRVIDTWPYGTRSVMSTEPATRPEDFEGLRMRAVNAPLYVATVRALGASPTPMALGDAYIALQQGMIDAVEGPIPTARTNRFDEVVDHVILTEHAHSPNFLVTSDAVWRRLDPGQRTLLTEKTAEYGERVARCLEEQTRELLDEWAETGAVTVVDGVDRGAFRERARSEVPQRFGWHDDYVRLAADR